MQKGVHARRQFGLKQTETHAKIQPQVSEAAIR